MNVDNPRISVIIPVRNEEKKIRDCLNGIINQSLSVYEIIVIDSGSTDRTLDILNEFPFVRVIQIPANEFNHGDTRNLGVRESNGDFCLFTVGDAVAYDSDWLKNLFAGFTSDDIVGVCGSQVVPHDSDKNPVEWFRPITDPPVIAYKFTRDQFEKLSPLEKKAACSWDDVTALYRKSILISIPFQRITYGEDALWAKEALLAGHSLVYTPLARVYHYHLENYEFTLKRTFTTLYFRYKQFGLISTMPNFTFMNRLSLIKTLFFKSNLSLKDSMYWLQYNLNLRRARNEAFILFYSALKSGEGELENLHKKICGAPPIPVKK